MAYDPLTTVQSLKAWLQTGGGANNASTVDDAELNELIQVASDLIGRHLTRPNLGSVYSYTESYFQPRGFVNRWQGTFDILLRHWPVASLSFVNVNNSEVNILTSATVGSGAAGVYLCEGDPEDLRKLKFLGLYCDTLIPIQVVYTAGYAVNAIPRPLQQAANQFASEIFRSATWIGFKSKSIAGEMVTFDTGTEWGMSKRIQTMLKPFENNIPFMWQ